MGSIPVRVTKKKSTSIEVLFFLVMRFAQEPTAQNARTLPPITKQERGWVRIRRSKIWELAHKAQSVRILAKDEIPVFAFHLCRGAFIL